MGTGTAFAKGPPITVLILTPEQRVGRDSVAVDGALMVFDPRDLTLQKRQALGKFVLRIRAEVLACQQARRVAFRPGAFIEVHRAHIV